MQFLNIAIAILFFMSGCATAAKSKFDKKEIKKPIIYKFDLDKDGEKEIIQIEDNSTTNETSIISVLSKDKKLLDKANVESYSSAEFIDLDNNGYKQIVIYTKDESKYCSLAIYSLKNKKLDEIFTIGSPVALDVNFKSCIPRIKAGLPRDATNSQGPTYEVWVWSGYKFIKDHNE